MMRLREGSLLRISFHVCKDRTGIYVCGESERSQPTLYLASAVPLDNNLRFLPGVYHEDGGFWNRMTYLAQSCYVLPDPVYVYRLRKTGSIMSSRKQK